MLLFVCCSCVCSCVHVYHIARLSIRCEQRFSDVGQELAENFWNGNLDPCSHGGHAQHPSNPNSLRRQAWQQTTKDLDPRGGSTQWRNDRVHVLVVNQVPQFKSAKSPIRCCRVRGSVNADSKSLFNRCTHFILISVKSESSQNRVIVTLTRSDEFEFSCATMYYYLLQPTRQRPHPAPMADDRETTKLCEIIRWD